MPRGTHKGGRGEVIIMPGGISGDDLCLRDLLSVTPLLSPPILAAGEELGHVQTHP